MVSDNSVDWGLAWVSRKGIKKLNIVVKFQIYDNAADLMKVYTIDNGFV